MPPPTASQASPAPLPLVSSPAAETPNHTSHFNTFSTQKPNVKKKKAKCLLKHQSEHVTLLLKTRTPHSGPGAPADWPLPP